MFFSLHISCRINWKADLFLLNLKFYIMDKQVMIFIQFDSMLSLGSQICLLFLDIDFECIFVNSILVTLISDAKSVRYHYGL